MKYHQNKKGNVLLYIIVTMTIVTALGTGAFYLTNTSSFSGLSVSAKNKAKYLAEAGIRYTLANLRTLQNTNPPLPEYTLNTLTSSDKFILEINGIGVGGNINIYSTGLSNPSTPYEASHKIKLENIIPSQYQTLTKAPFSFAGTGSGGIASLTTRDGTSGVGNIGTGTTGVSVDTVNQQVNLGGGQYDTNGCLWYKGWADRNGSDCIAGNCNFNKGIRAYFDFQYNTPWQGEGFTFAIINGLNNTYNDCGGGLGEYMAYAGPGKTGNGLQPPKIAVEFDPFLNLVPPPILPDPNVYPCPSYPNDVCACYPSLCSDNPAVCAPNSRNDNTFSNSKHSTFVYWGDNNPPSTPNTCTDTSKTHDDNRHRAGGGPTDPNDPQNPYGCINQPLGTINKCGMTPDCGINSDCLTYPYMIQDFDSFGTVITSPFIGMWLSFRLEIDRVDDATKADYRQYKMRVWLKPYAVYLDSNGVTYAVYKDKNKVTFDDTSQKFNKNNDYPPDFQQTITLTQTWHNNFDRILFGWTQATDSTNTQTVIIRNFTIDFKNRNDF